MTGIQWTEATWNPVTGCDRVSPGCDRCYALGMAKRLKAMGQAKYQRDGDPRTSGPGFAVTLHPTTLDLPLRWRKPRTVFVNSMSDLFHPAVPEPFIAQVVAVMALTPQHTYQVLTKRPARMRALLSRPHFWADIDASADRLHQHHHVGRRQRGQQPSTWRETRLLPNVWLGTSVETQQHANIRVPHLLQTPATVRFLSCEPLLGPLDLTRIPLRGRAGAVDALAGAPGFGPVHWVIVGGESGPRHRPLALDWARGLRDQCELARRAFFFKQVGGTTPKAGGRLLDGRTWDQYPPRLHADIPPVVSTR
jgi:protein gp37